MLRSFFVAIALALGVGGERASPPPEQPATPVPKGVLGILWDEVEPGGELVRMDSLTLEPVGPRLDLPSGNATTDYSPDYRRLALAYPEPAKLEIVDVRHMKSLGTVDLGVDGWISFLSWERGYLFAVVDGEAERAVVTVDPVGLRVQVRHRIDGTILHVSRGAEQQVVLLLAPQSGIGPLRLAVVGGKGMTTTPISGFLGGWETDQEGDDVRTRHEIPALVVDEVGKRALVVSGGTVAEISLKNLAVRAHTLSQPVSLLGRLRDWLEPAAHAKLVDGPWREGAWVGDGLFVVSGENYSSDQGRHHHAEPAGISLVDTRDWSVRQIDEDSVGLVVTENAIVGHGGYEFGGVSGYDKGGERRFDLLPDTPVWLQLVGGFVYAVHENSKTFTVIDPALGKVVGTAKTEEPLTLVEG
jgi:hypothetical protein